MSKTIEISMEKLSLQTAGLNLINEHIKVGTWSQSVFLQLNKSHKIQSTVLPACAKLGYIQKLSRGEYKSMLEKFEPFHARKVLELESKMRKESYYLKQRERKLVKQEEPTPLKKNETVQLKENKRQGKKKNSWSILWGLIKFN